MGKSYLERHSKDRAGLARWLTPTGACTSHGPGVETFRSEFPFQNA